MPTHRAGASVCKCFFSGSQGSLIFRALKHGLPSGFLVPILPLTLPPFVHVDTNSRNPEGCYFVSDRVHSLGWAEGKDPTAVVILGFVTHICRI